MLVKKLQIEVEKREAQQKRSEAQTDAEVIKIRGEALKNNPIVLRDRYIKAIKPTDKVILEGNQSIILDAENGNRNGST